MNIKVTVAVHPRDERKEIDFVVLDEQALMEAASRNSRYLFGDQVKLEVLRFELRAGRNSISAEAAGNKLVVAGGS